MDKQALGIGLSVVALCACGGGGGSGGSSVGDVNPPSVAIVSPNPGATVNGTVTVTADATDDVGVAGVQFRIDGADRGPEDTTAPFELVWNTGLDADGPHMVTAMARDTAGNMSLSTQVAVTVDSASGPDTNAPTVSITAPSAGSTLTGTTTVVVAAVDDVGVSGVQLLLDGALLGGRLTSPPYEYVWDTTTVPDGSYTLTAVAGDPSLNVGTSAGVALDVDNSSPALGFSTMTGGDDKDSVRDVFIDDLGFIYIAGGTASAAFPTTPGAYDRTFNGVHDAYVMKFSPSGTLVFSSVFGGPNYDRAYAIEVDAAGYIYIAGRAGDGYPTTPGSAQPVFGGSVLPNSYGLQDGFVTKITPDGSGIVWSTFFGGDDNSVIRDIDLDDAGNVYLAMIDVHRSNPHVNPGAFDTTLSGPSDGLAAKISADGSSVVWATYLGGSGDDGGTPSVRVASGGHLVVLDHSQSTDAPVTPGAYQTTLAGAWDLLIWKIQPDGSALDFCTYFGGSSGDFSETHGLSLDAAEDVIITATTRSTDLPFVPAAIPTPFQATYAGTGGATTGGTTNYPGDCFAAKLSPDGTTLLAFTYIGGTEGEGAEGSAVDADGNVYFGGATYSPDFPCTPNALQLNKAGEADTFLVKLSPDFTSVSFATFWGGSNDEFGRTMAIGPSGEIVVAGSTYSSDYPTTPGAYDASFHGVFDAFVVCVGLP
jgi:Bacterial Ig domain